MSKGFKNISVDLQTFARLHVLAGPMPVATYIRDITTLLEKDKPEIKDLPDWYQLTPLKKEIDNILSILSVMDEKTSDIFFKFLKNICQLRAITHFTLDAIEQIHPGINLKLDLLEKAREASNEEFEAIKERFFHQ